MKKIIISVIIAVAVILANCNVVHAENDNILEIKSKSAILIEANSGTVIYEKNCEEKRHPASVTKVMTLLLIFDEIEEGRLSLDDTVTISKHAASMGGSQCFFEEGETQKVDDMLKCIEVASGNDAAVAMAEHIAGSEEAFVKKMNDKAETLGMTNTHFENACGLDNDNHYTCAKDISTMSRELITKHPDIYNYSQIWMDSIIHKTARGESQFDLANTNKFLKLYDGANGLKTGFTNKAGFCISATAKRNDITLIAVVMGAATKEDRNEDIKKLMDYGFSNCNIYNDNSVLENDVYANVKNGIKKTIKGKSNNTKQLVYFGNTEPNIEKKIELKTDLKAPIKKDTEIGKVIYYCNDKCIGEEIIYSSEDNPASTYKYYLANYVKLICMEK